MAEFIVQFIEVRGMLYFILRIIAISGGLLAAYVALFMYEDEEGILQNRVEELWIDIDSRAQIVGSTTVALINKVSQSATSGINFLFGPHLFSIRSVGASTSWSSATALLVCGFCGGFIGNQWAWLCAFLCIFSAVFPAIFGSRWLLPVSLLPILFCTIFFFAELSAHGLRDRAPIILIGTLALSFVSDIVLIMIVRVTIFRAASGTKALQVFLAVLVQLVCALCVLIGPVAATVIFEGRATSIATRPVFLSITECTSLFNAFTALLVLALAGSLTGILVHRIFWPFAARAVYTVARYEIVRNKKFLWVLATGCFAYGLQLTEILGGTFVSLFSK